jgi:hypothetical protein
MTWFAVFCYGIADDLMSTVELHLLAAAVSRYETSCLTKSHLELT